MRTERFVRRGLLAALWLIPSVALASVGSVNSLEGEATRTPSGGTPSALQVGSGIELGDTLEVKTGNLKLTLNDSSILMLAAGSRLHIDQARFEKLDDRQFSAKLLIGTLWAKVTRALMDGEKFEVVTERAVAGVRGTTFIVDVAPEGDERELATSVQVVEGRVEIAVRERLREGAAVPGAAPARDAAKVQLLTAGERLAVRRRGIERLAARGLPERFERFIRQHERDQRRDAPPDRRSPQQLERLRNRLNGPRRP